MKDSSHINRNSYQSPLVERYGDSDMSYNFSSNNKFQFWRRLWIALAESEKELGLDVITDEQISEMKRFEDDINFDVAQEREAKVRHDVMAHVYAFGEQCPNARPIIHLGATSAFVQDNTELIIMKEGLNIITKKLVNVIANLKTFAGKNKSVITLGFTHFQAAQLTTVGKRACLWIQEFIFDLEDLEYRLDKLKFRGVKGTTGTQASFMTLFKGDEEKVKQLDVKVANKMGFKDSYPITGQTYSRKIDSQILNVLSGIAQSAHKFATDIRLLHHLKEIEEPFEPEQIGSSAMAYKRNPMRAERVCALARHVICNSLNPAFTAAGQWLERTLDDSANKRLSTSEAFLTTDVLLNIVLNVTGDLVVNHDIIKHHVNLELPFMATENILMEVVNKGGDRQLLHERIKIHSMETVHILKKGVDKNDLLERIGNDEAFKSIKMNLQSIAEPKKFIGRAPQQVDDFVKGTVMPILDKHKDVIGMKSELAV
ncbi:MAG: adenylosuccinate lyase [Candidatus Anammoxibacter sp.]